MLRFTAALYTMLYVLYQFRRATMVLGLLKKEVELCKLQADIREQVGVRVIRNNSLTVSLLQIQLVVEEKSHMQMYCTSVGGSRWDLQPTCRVQGFLKYPKH